MFVLHCSSWLCGVYTPFSHYLHVNSCKLTLTIQSAKYEYLFTKYLKLETVMVRLFDLDFSLTKNLAKTPNKCLFVVAQPNDILHHLGKMFRQTF